MSHENLLHTGLRKHADQTSVWWADKQRKLHSDMQAMCSRPLRKELSPKSLACYSAPNAAPLNENVVSVIKGVSETGFRCVVPAVLELAL